MDDKLPASSGDFSQGPESYGEISTILPSGGVLRQTDTSGQFNRYSPQKAGTFTI